MRIIVGVIFLVHAFAHLVGFVLPLSLANRPEAYLFNCRSRTRSAFEGLFPNPFIWIAAASIFILVFII